MRRSLEASALAVVLLFSCAPATAGERQHTVAAGESASAIAKRYYGEYGLAGLLLEFNGRVENLLHPGEKLRIPYSVVHRVRAGESWSVIAQRYLKRPSGWRAIAALNGLDPRAPLRVGQEVVVPVVLDYRLRRGDSLAGLAERFYRDASRASLLADFNDVDDPRRLSVGQSLGIPLNDFRLASAPPAKMARTRATEQAPVRGERDQAARTAPSDVADGADAPDAARGVPGGSPGTPAEAGNAGTRPRADDPRVTARLRSARDAWREGEYDRVLELLEAVDVASASDDQRGGYLRLLAFVHVAFDAREPACSAWSRVDPTSVHHELDPELVSPKIRELLAACSS